jgi:hypothetical protein
MNDIHWKEIELLGDLAYRTADEFLRSHAISALKDAMQKAMTELPAEWSLSLDVSLSVFDREREASLPIMRRSLCSADTNEPYLADADSSIHRYVVDGEVCNVPQDRCPNCWNEWDFKLGAPEMPVSHRNCPNCEYEIGKEIKLLLDSDLCPFCEKGTLSFSAPRCSACGFAIDPALVAWG